MGENWSSREKSRGCYDGAMVHGTLSVPGRPTNLDNNSRAKACCTCSRCGWGLLDIVSLVHLFSFCLSGRRPGID